MDSIIVAVECDAYAPVLGEAHFMPGDSIEPANAYYYPLLWAGLAGAPSSDVHTVPSSNDISASLKAARDQAKES